MLRPKEYGQAGALANQSAITTLLDVSIAQLRHGQTLSSPRARAERGVALRHYMKLRARLIAAGVRKLFRRIPHQRT